jgi:hypothetical protein
MAALDPANQVLPQPLSDTLMPGSRLRQGFAGPSYQRRRSISEGGHKAGHRD